MIKSKKIIRKQNISFFQVYGNLSNIQIIPEFNEEDMPMIYIELPIAKSPGSKSTDPSEAFSTVTLT